MPTNKRLYSSCYEGWETLTQIRASVSIDETLFADAERAAAELQLSRSGLYALALREFLERRESQRLLNELNAVYDGSPDPNTEALLQGMHGRRKRLAVEDPWT